jgi:hypothetical protein
LIGRTSDSSDGRKPLPIENFLVNLEADPGEKTNLASEHPEMVERLRTMHEEYLSGP